MQWTQPSTVRLWFSTLNATWEGSIHLKYSIFSIGLVMCFPNIHNKENTGVRKLQVNPSASMYKPPPPVQMQNCYLHLQSLVRSERRIYNQLPFNNSSELGIFFKDGLHVQDSPRKPDLQWQEVKGRGVSNSLGQTKYSVMFHKLPAFVITEFNQGILRVAKISTFSYQSIPLSQIQTDIK